MSARVRIRTKLGKCLIKPAVGIKNSLSEAIILTDVSSTTKII